MKNRVKRLAAIGGALAVAFAGLVACTGEPAPPPTPEAVVISDDLIEAAKEEGTLTLYTAMDEAVTADWVAGFTEEYGIAVELYRADTQTLLDRISIEQSSDRGIADAVILSGIDTWQSAVAIDAVGPYTPTAAVNGELSEDQIINELFYPLASYTFGIGVNTDQATSSEVAAIRRDGLAALDDESFEGRLVTSSVHGASIVYAHYFMIAEDPDLGWDYIEDVASLGTDVAESTTAMSSQLISGRYAAAIGMNDLLMVQAALEGAPVQVIYPERAVTTPFGIGVGRLAPHPNAARLFEEWAVSAEASAALAALRPGMIPSNSQAEMDTSSLDTLDWYEPPTELWADWVVDSEFVDGREDFAARWDDAFGYVSG
jgi:iron(III) transport system substrate-binding protein